MTNTLHFQNGNNHWVQENKLDGNMDSNYISSQNELLNNGTSSSNILNQSDENLNHIESSSSISETSRINVLTHIEETIDSVVKFWSQNSDSINENSKTKKKNCSNNNSSTPNKKKKNSQKPTENLNKKKDTSTGPYIRVEKKKNQINFIVVNNALKFDEKDKYFNKPNYSSIAKKTSVQNNIQKPNDNTWICIFCKKMPHYKKLGDLFGPHELSENKNELDTPNTNNISQLKNEIWFHEDCIVWSNGIYLAGNRVRNIDEVVRECSEITCCECKLKGANLGCVQKGCNQTFHFICAKISGCDMDEESFSIFCSNHKKTNESHSSNH